MTPHQFSGQHRALVEQGRRDARALRSAAGFDTPSSDYAVLAALDAIIDA